MYSCDTLQVGETLKLYKKENMPLKALSTSLMFLDNSVKKNHILASLL